MSANLFWEPAKRKKFDLDEGAPSDFMNLMQRVFGSPLPVLRKNDIPKLEALRDAEESQRRITFERLIDAVDKHDEIQLSAQY